MCRTFPLSSDRLVGTQVRPHVVAGVLGDPGQQEGKPAQDGVGADALFLAVVDPAEVDDLLQVAPAGTAPWCGPPGTVSTTSPGCAPVTEGSRDDAVQYGGPRVPVPGLQAGGQARRAHGFWSLRQLTARHPLAGSHRGGDIMGTWFWLNIPLALLFLRCWAGIPMWHTCKRWDVELKAKNAELAARTAPRRSSRSRFRLR